MKFEVSDLEWEKMDGHWRYQSRVFTRPALPYVIQDLPIPNGMDIAVECTPRWVRETRRDVWGEYDDEEDQLIRTIGGVEDFVAANPLNPLKRRHVHVEYEHGNLFPEGIRVGYKKALWKDAFEEIKGENWLRVVERGEYEKDRSHYCHAFRQVIAARVSATVHPRQVAMENWYPHHLRPQDLMADEVMVVNYGRYILDLTLVPESAIDCYRHWSYTRLLKVHGNSKKDGYDIKYVYAVYYLLN